ncbi:hypothetical protein E3N88_45312 [Mikania micrantha]|uniref:Dilute domain-containing protein n=1 Tax=Mikania micrantha TaxID=192012 RepID=A0A5N6L9I2_9ASTR|nr:hypothetical protein E3N88_45312 [Mikania micrantha]
MAPNKFLSGRSKSIIQRTHSGTLIGDKKSSMELLLKCIAQHLGFAGNRPIAACIIYKCLLQWRSFEVEKTKKQYNNDVLAYWLSNASTLLLLLQCTLKASGSASGNGPQRRRSSAALFGRMTSSLQGTPHMVELSFANGSLSNGVEGFTKVEAKYPALLFKQQLTAYVEKIYGMIRDNLKKEISPLLGMCIQAPRISRASLVKGSSRSASSTAQQTVIAHWQGKELLRVPPFLVRKVFTQIFSFVNVQLFNSLLLRRECCSFSNGEYVKADELQYAGSAWDELKHIRQAIAFLVIHQKPKKTLNEISRDLCPILSIQQLYRISTMYWDDKYGTQSHSLSVDDISKSMDQIQISDIEPPPLIRENSGFSFLLPRVEKNVSKIPSSEDVSHRLGQTLNRPNAQSHISEASGRLRIDDDDDEDEGSTDEDEATIGTKDGKTSRSFAFSTLVHKGLLPLCSLLIRSLHSAATQVGMDMLY